MARPAPEPDSIVTLPWRSTETRSSLTTACRRMGRLGATSPPVSEIVSLLAVGEFSRPSLTRSHPKPAALEVRGAQRNGGLGTPRSRTMTGAGRKGFACIQVGFRRRAVDIHVLLTGELHDRVHDLVGDPPQHVSVVAGVGVSAEVHLLADPDLWPAHRRDLEEPRWDQLRVDHAHRDHRHAGLQYQPGDAGLALVEAAVRRTGSFRIDAEQLSMTQHTKHTVHAGGAGPTSGAVHGNLADALEEPGQNPAPDAPAVEQFDFCRKGEPSLDHCG